MSLGSTHQDGEPGAETTCERGAGLTLCLLQASVSSSVQWASFRPPARGGQVRYVTNGEWHLPRPTTLHPGEPSFRRTLAEPHRGWTLGAPVPGKGKAPSPKEQRHKAERGSPAK